MWGYWVTFVLGSCRPNRRLNLQLHNNDSTSWLVLGADTDAPLHPWISWSMCYTYYSYPWCMSSTSFVEYRRFHTPVNELYIARQPGIKHIDYGGTFIMGILSLKMDNSSLMIIFHAASWYRIMMFEEAYIKILEVGIRTQILDCHHIELVMLEEGLTGGHIDAIFFVVVFH